jgi:hypothetical protein
VPLGSKRLAIITIGFTIADIGWIVPNIIAYSVSYTAWMKWVEDHIYARNSAAIGRGATIALDRETDGRRADDTTGLALGRANKLVFAVFIATEVLC